MDTLARRIQTNIATAQWADLAPGNVRRRQLMTQWTQMTHSAVALSASAQAAGPSVRAPGPPGSPWWRVSWSVPAALRAVRATVVIPSLFALAFKVFGVEQLTVFAVFGSFGTLVLASFGGTRRDKALAHIGLAVAGSVAIIIGTLASGSTWLAVVVTVPTAFAIYFADSAGPNAASGVTACMLAFVLPVASAGTASSLLPRLAGWWLASVASTVAVLAISPRSPGDRLREQASTLAAAMSHQLGQALRGRATDADRQASVAAKHELMNLFVGTPYRPVGLAAPDQALASVIHLLDWCTSLICDTVDGHLDLEHAPAADRDVLRESAIALSQISALLRGRDATVELDRIWRARKASARHLRELTGGQAGMLLSADSAFHAQAIGVAATAAVGEALIAARRASPAAIAAQRRRWLHGYEASPGDAPASGRDRRAGVGWLIATGASLRSVWFRNSVRGAVALAAAVAVAKLLDVQHAFWVVLGTLSVLRTSAAATGATAMRALAGTVAGFVVGAALLVGIGTSPVVLWVAFPLAVLVAAYTPGTAPFVAGQAAFTVTIVVLFNLLAPAGWRVGLLRVEDVALGCAVSLIVGVLFWPRGTAAVVGDNLAYAFRCGASYLTDAAGWVLGQRSERPDRAIDAIAAGTRLDDAIRGYLTEQGSRRIAKNDLWALTMAATRLRLTAHSLASLSADGDRAPSLHWPPQAEAGGVRGRLARDAADLAAFYDSLADEVAKPSRDGSTPVLVPVPAMPAEPGLRERARRQARYRPEDLWVGYHLQHLNAHSADVTGPAERLARLRRTPWWR